MKSTTLFLSLFLLLYSCQQSKKSSIIIDSSVSDTVKAHIEFASGEYFSNFKTPIETRFFTNGHQTESIIKDHFSMISWYSNRKDTIDLVAHVDKFETQALLIRFVKGKRFVYFFRAPHDLEGSRYFKKNQSDTFSHEIEIVPIHYQLKLSEIPDTINKQIVFGHIDFESGDYYDKRDSLNKKHKVKMKFYFCSQYRGHKD